ncbi:PHP domain-containing protein [Halalkalibacter urbisdiaboli]|uniref:PHP domain-containing protein n=1 Tax=Halalkalibacter urbisdiaboli TaxID=1960589 RepID=UPI000B4503F7|nr:PHP domain-containing protein [Halalkalibacter urbisdiaboli]
MKIDFHTHVKLSKKSPFLAAYFVEMMQEAKASGLDAIAVTEHFNTLRFQDIYEFLDQNYDYRQHYYEAEGMKVFPGIEVDIKETGHILLIGPREHILAIREALEPHTHEQDFIQFDRLLDLVEGYNILKIGAHPYRSSTPLHHLSIEQLSRLDAFDLNGKDQYSQGLKENYQQVMALGERLNIPIIGGSDTHHFLQYGCISNRFARACETIEELRSNIVDRAYEIEQSSCLYTKVKAAKLVKKLLKKKLENVSEALDEFV